MLEEPNERRHGNPVIAIPLVILLLLVIYALSPIAIVFAMKHSWGPKPNLPALSKIYGPLTRLLGPTATNKYGAFLRKL